VEALRGINLSIAPGEYLALVGQNGSGKTTLAKHLNGLLKPTSGRVTVKNQDICNTKVSQLSRQVGYVFQNPDDMLFCSSVEEEVAFGPRMIGCTAQEIRQRVEQTIELLGLAPLRDQHPFALSLGDRQRVAVACALSMDPEVFVFDEPTTGQDYFGGKSIMAIIDRLHQAGRTVIIITHDMQMVAEHARRVVVLSGGQIALDATPEQAFTCLDVLEKLCLRPPQVTLFACQLGMQGKAILSVDQMCAWLSAVAAAAPGSLAWEGD
jgi:energy-coupling factor transport system ATP-binding protein